MHQQVYKKYYKSSWRDTHGAQGEGFLLSPAGGVQSLSLTASAQDLSEILSKVEAQFGTGVDYNDSEIL